MTKDSAQRKYKSFSDAKDDGAFDKEDKKESRRLAKFWLDEVDKVDQLQKSWLSKGDNIIKRFRDERNRADADNRRRLNVLWSNIKVLMPALYGKAPTPYIERRFLQHDPVARLSASILERCVKNEMEVNGLHKSLRKAVLDYLLPGRGVVWVRYEPEIGEIGDSIPIQSQGMFDDALADTDEDGDLDDEKENDPRSEKLQSTGEQLLSEQCPVDYINWKDFYIFPATARVWDEVQAIGKRIYISKQEAIQRFGKEVGKELHYTSSQTDQTKRVPYSDTSIFQQNNNRNIEIFEIWNKTDRNIYWVSEGYDYLCDKKKDFLKLKDFFPIPEPISATLTNESLIPVPDYVEYQDQALQIDELTHRLSMLTKACKIAGCYDASNTALKRLLREGFENDLIPVDAWAAFADKGGVQGGIALLPIDEIQKVIETLTKVRQQLMMDLDTVTGISDVIRGTTDSRETLGGIRLKNNNAGTRLSDRQDEVAKFARNTIAIVAEVIAVHYTAKKIIESSSVLYDEELQPDAIMEELEPPADQQQQQQPQQQGPQQGQQQQLLPPGGGMNPLQGGMGAIGQQPQPQNNILPFPAPNPRMPPAMNSPMGMQPQNPFFQPMPIDPIEIITQRVEHAIELLRKDVPRGYRIDIETDSTIFGDAAQERQDASMFVGEVAKFLAGAAQLGEQLPEAVPALCQTLLWQIRKFRVGRDVEAVWDDFIKKVQKKVKDQSKNPKPDPKQQEAQAKLEQIKATTAAQAQKVQMEQQAQQQNDQRDFQKAQAEDQREAELDKMKMQMEQEKNRMEMEKMQLEHQIAMAELKMKMEAVHVQTNAKIQQTQMQTHAQAQQHQQTMEMDQQQHAHNIEQSNLDRQEMHEQHQQNIQQTHLQGEQAQAQHKQKMEQSQLAGKQATAQHHQKMTQMKHQQKKKVKK